MSDELKTRPDDARPDYEPPRAVRMDGRSDGRGADCVAGSGASEACGGNGNLAQGNCMDNGQSASGAWCFAGNSPAGPCLDFGIGD